MPVVGNVYPVGVEYVPLPLTVTVSVSTVALLYISVNVIVPVGLFPADRKAVSFSLTPTTATFLCDCAEDAPRVTELGLGDVES